MATFIGAFLSTSVQASQTEVKEQVKVQNPQKMVEKSTVDSSEKVSSTYSKKQLFKGKVLKVLLDYESSLSDGQKQREQLLKIKLSDGRMIETINSVPPTLAYQIILKKGDRIVITEDDGAFFIEGYYRENICWILLGVFVLLILWVGGRKGVLAFTSLAIKISILLFVFIPVIKAGFSPIWAATIFCVVSTFLTISLVSGLNYKTVSACFGTVAGVLIAGLIGTWAVNAAKLSGLLEPEMESLHYQFPLIKITEMISAGVLIGSLGASMDVGISVASALYEVYIAAPHKKMKELFEIGMNVGQDVMGTMVNTLILAYAGSSLSTIILITQIDPSFLMNMELVVKELILSVVGSIGLILTIPLTALLSSYFYPKLQVKEG
ncbi:MAG: YibE/F family protein [Candidatus Caenarcaniphilales bacterium]|nr:YibE/F family protein [Candidatus Caenarcaniphilales bacterium]